MDSELDNDYIHKLTVAKVTNCCYMVERSWLDSWKAGESGDAYGSPGTIFNIPLVYLTAINA